MKTQSTVVDQDNVIVPRARWGGRWLRALTDLEKVPDDGKWHSLTEYGKTTGYQVARELNLARSLPGDFEFGVIQGENESVLVARHVA